MSERYRIVELAPDERARRQWGVHDSKTSQLMRDEGEPITFGTADGAQDWIVRQNYLNDSVMHRA